MKNEKLSLIIITLLAVFSFFVSFFLINPVLHYHNQQIAWHSGRLFFQNFAGYPGGIGEYISLFVSQWFTYKWIGSVIIALTGFLSAVFLYKTIGNRWNNIKLVILLVPLIQILSLVLYFDFRFHYSVSFNLLAVSAGIFFTSLVCKKKSITALLITLFIGIVIYMVCGGLFFLIYMGSSTILFLNKPFLQSAIQIFIIALFAIIFPYLAYKFFYLISLKYSYLKSVPDVAVMLRYGKPLIFYATLAVLPVVLLTVKITSLLPPFKKSPITSDNNGSLSGGAWIGILIQLFLLTGISVLLILKTYKPEERIKVEVDYWAYQQDWDKVISLSNDLEEYDRMVNFQFNRALLNTGQVLDRIFEYQQKLGTLGLFLDVPFTAEITLPNSDLYFDLGNIDESLRYAFESETLMKNSPRVLKRLILNCIILDKMDAAITYLNILESNPLEKKWAQKYRKLANNKQLASDDDLIKMKRNQLSKAEGMKITPPLKLLQQLEKNPKNKKAVEYLIASDLMEHDLTSLEQDFKYLKQFRILKLPVSIEEAVILFRSQNKSNEFLNSFRISGETLTRFREFAKLSKASGGDREKAKIATKKFEKTYWYYALFVSPRVTNLKLETTPVDANY